jgi:hypothetical protein
MSRLYAKTTIPLAYQQSLVAGPIERLLAKKYIYSISGDFKCNSDDLKTTSLELTHPFHASFPFFRCKFESG